MKLIWEWCEFSLYPTFTFNIWYRIGKKYHQFFIRVEYRIVYHGYLEKDLPRIINIGG
jgi:hypothetical protein